MPDLYVTSQEHCQRAQTHPSDSWQPQADQAADLQAEVVGSRAVAGCRRISRSFGERSDQTLCQMTAAAWGHRLDVQHVTVKQLLLQQSHGKGLLHNQGSPESCWFPSLSPEWPRCACPSQVDQCTWLLHQTIAPSPCCPAHCSQYLQRYGHNVHSVRKNGAQSCQRQYVRCPVPQHLSVHCFSMCSQSEQPVKTRIAASCTSPHAHCTPQKLKSLGGGWRDLADLAPLHQVRWAALKMSRCFLIAFLWPMWIIVFHKSSPFHRP